MARRFATSSLETFTDKMLGDASREHSQTFAGVLTRKIHKDLHKTLTSFTRRSRRPWQSPHTMFTVHSRDPSQNILANLPKSLPSVKPSGRFLLLARAEIQVVVTPKNVSGACLFGWVCNTAGLHNMNVAHPLAGVGGKGWILNLAILALENPTGAHASTVKGSKAQAVPTTQ